MKTNKHIPRHIGIIQDGNRRWAKQRGLQVSEGHKQGFETFRKIADASLERGIEFLSVYAFSTENWNRSKEEVGFLMGFIKLLLKKYVNDLVKKNVRFVWLGCENGLDASLLKMLKAAELATKNNSAATFCLCFNYGGQQEIVDAANSAIQSGKSLSVESLEANLYGGSDIPPVDYVIRTSGEQRISNFMLWRAAYAEMYFTNVLWPDFSVAEFDKALDEYKQRQRRYGS